MLMRRLPASPSRTQALIQFEPVLLDRFQTHTVDTDSEIRDSMHYALFSVTDRFCASAAWMIAPRLGISMERFAPAACSIETLRCSIEFKLRPGSTSTKYVEPAIAEAAAYGLLPLAFEMVLASKGALTESERCRIAHILARAVSPAHMLSALHRESKLTRHRHTFSLAEIQDIQQEKVAPAFEAVGETLALLSMRPIATGSSGSNLGSWFKKLGLFAHWVEDFTSGAENPATGIDRIVALPEAMDVIKSLEAELLDRARELEIRDAAHDIIEPLSDVLKALLQ